MSGDTSSDDSSQGEEYLENGWCSTAGGKDRRVEVINGIALPKCRRGGLCRKGYGECGLCERCMCVCAGGTRKEKWDAAFFPNGVGRRGRRKGSKNQGKAAAVGLERQSRKRSAAAASMAATAQQSMALQRDSDDEGSDAAVDEVTLFVCFICVCSPTRELLSTHTHTQKALADVKSKSKQEAVSLNALGKFMNVHTHSIRKAAGKASDEHPDNKTRLLRFVDSILEKAFALVCPNDATGFYFCVCTHSSHLHTCARTFIYPQVFRIYITRSKMP